MTGAPTSKSTKHCPKCNQTLPVDKFHRNNKKLDGLNHCCIDCAAARRSAVARADPKGAWATSTVVLKRYTCKKRNLPFDLTAEYLVSIAPDICPVFHVPIAYDRRASRRMDTRPDPHSPSVDRLDDSKGYTKDNIIIVSHLANIVRNTATPAQIRMVADFYDRLFTPPNLAT